MSNMTTACFLLALIGFISGQFTHQVPYELARGGRSKRISCTVDSSVTISSTAIHWYRQKPKEALQRILYFGVGASTATVESEFSRRFNSGKKDSTFSVTITGASNGDAAIYYCALWRGNAKVFSSGTRLYVSDENPKVPKVSVYPVSRLQLNEKHVLLCQARDMFPDLVKFTWQAEDQNGQVELKDDEILEQKDMDQYVKITSMLIVDKEKVKTSKFTCSVEHENRIINKVDIPRPQQDEEKPQPIYVPAKTCPTPKAKEGGKEAEDEEEEQEAKEEKLIYGVFELRRSLYLFSLMYVILLVKSVLYSCTASVLLCKRNSVNMKMLSG